VDLNPTVKASCDPKEFRERLISAWPELSEDQRSRVVRFYELVCVENEIQNLTRLISPQDFVEGHVLDVKALRESGLVSFPAMDLGSGGGVPGLLYAAIDPNPWILVDSEGRKADFLTRAAKELELPHVLAFGKRAEEILRNTAVESVVARAVGPVERIYGWIRGCSTWNNLVLLKGPGWGEEWAKFQTAKNHRELEIDGQFDYTVSAEEKQRRILRITRAKKKK
jgi:16S rRNA (guanine(527)-N(7))-methyltransferase RsmG